MSKGAGNTRPFTEAHAIVWVDLGLGFDEPLPETALRELDATLVSPLMAQEFVLENDGESENDESISVALERKSEDGELLEFVHVHNDHAHTQLRDYRGWDLTRDSLFERLGPVIELARSGACKPSALYLSFQDVFIGEKPEQYDVREVFKPNDFLPAVIFNGEKFWGHQLRLAINAPENGGSWSVVFSKLSIDAAVRTTNDDKKEHVSSLIHRQTMFLNDEYEAAEALSDSGVKAMLDVMHNRNRDVMLKILSDEMCARIGLEKESIQ